MNELILKAFDQAPVLAWISDASGHAVHFNKTWLEFTGAELEQELGSGWRARVHPDDVSALGVETKAIERREPFRSRYRLRRHDGEWRWVLDVGVPILEPDGKLKGFVGTCTDITAQQRAEHELQLERQRLELAQEAAGIGVYDWDIASGCIVWTPEMFRLHGIDPSTPGEQIYSQWLERIHPDDRERADAETREFVEAANDLKIEFRILHPVDGLRWIEGRGRMFRDAWGRPLRMIGVNLDVTDRRTAEEVWRESEQRLRDIADNFPGIIFRRVTFPDGRVEYPFFGGSLERLFPDVEHAPASGWRIEDILKFVHFGDANEMISKFHAAAEQMVPLELEGRILTRDGTYRWARSLSTPRARDDGSIVWDGVILDITEQHLREGERERAATMLRMAMEVAGIGTWEYDPAAGSVLGSRVTNDIFGIEGDEPIPLERYLEALHPDDVGWVEQTLKEAAVEGGRLRRDYRLVSPDGIKWISSRASFVTLADGSDRLIGALFDVTDRKRQEAERAAALERQTTLLKELSHRIKNNLQMITSMLQLQISRLGPGESASELKKAQERIRAIGDLHGLLTYDEGYGSVDFGKYLARLAEGLRKAVLSESGLEIQCDVQPCALDADRAIPLALVANELVVNAVKHGFPDGGPGTLSLRLECKDAEIRLSICDNGVGIEPSAGRPGSLGMRLVNGLVDQLGARLEQSEDRGTCFLVSLPTVRDDEQGYPATRG